MSAEAITRTLGGHWHAGYGMIRCPAHDDNNPSCKVTDDPRKSDGIDVNCFAGCDWRDIKDELVKQGLLSGFARSPDLASSPRASRAAIEPEPEPDERALEIWNSGIEIEGTLAERYLTTHRALSGPFPFTLRFAPSIIHPGSGLTLPGLVAALQRPDRKVVAVQVTFLRARDGAKVTMTCPRLTIGRMGAGAVRLAPAGDVLGLAEGLETALSAQQLAALPVWACLGAQRLSKVAVPAHVKHVHIFGDNDGPGREQAEKAIKRFVDMGRRVTVRFPPLPHNDYNDLLRARIIPTSEVA